LTKQKNIAIALRIDEPYPHHQLVFSGIQKFAKEHPDWRCLIDEHPGFDLGSRGDRYVKYDGVIARASKEMQQRLKQMGIPLVNTHFQTSGPEVMGVYSDPVALGRLAADHLIDRGFRRLAIFSDSRHRHASAVMEAFLRRAAEEEITDCLAVEMGEEPYEKPEYWIDLEKQNTKLMDTLEPPIGVFVESPPHARLLVQMAQARGLRVPQDMAVLCQHNLRAVVEVSPQISRLEQNNELVGYTAAQMLDHLMCGVPVPKKQLFIPPIGAIGRESTDYFAVEDEIVAEALQYISGRLDKKLLVDDIAYELAVSSSLLKKKFAAALGRGVGEEIRRLRLEVAKRMLGEPSRQMASIAKESGFNSSDVMNRVFQRELGVTPTEYRKKILGDKQRRRGQDE